MNFINEELKKKIDRLPNQDELNSNYIVMGSNSVLENKFYTIMVVIDGPQYSGLESLQENNIKFKIKNEFHTKDECFPTIFYATIIRLNKKNTNRAIKILEKVHNDNMIKYGKDYLDLCKYFIGSFEVGLNNEDYTTQKNKENNEINE